MRSQRLRTSVRQRWRLRDVLIDLDGVLVNDRIVIARPQTVGKGIAD
jgi:hypothetical protein